MPMYRTSCKKDNDLKHLLWRVKDADKNAGLALNLKEMKVMSTEGEQEFKNWRRERASSRKIFRPWLSDKQ